MAEGMPFFTTSALRGGSQIQFLFHTVAEKCIRQWRERQLQDLERKKKGEAKDFSISLRSPFAKGVDESDDEYTVSSNPKKCDC